LHPFSKTGDEVRLLKRNGVAAENRVEFDFSYMRQVFHGVEPEKSNV
jgi:hypothetical protein